MYPPDRPGIYRSERALTLVEVMVALAVTVILVGGIFMVVQTSLATVIRISDNASREDEMTNITDILRNGFRNLSSRTRIVAQSVSMDGNRSYLMIFRNAPGFLNWRSAPESDNTIVLLAVMQDKDGFRKLCMRRFQAPQNMGADEFDPKAILKASSSERWLDLVGEFKEFSVRFLDGKSNKWSTDWNRPSERPALAEFKIVSELAKDTQSERSVMWIPPVKVQEAMQ